MSTPNQIQGGRWDEYLRSKYNLKGGPIAPEIAPEIIPVTSIPFDFEDYFLLRDKVIIGRANQLQIAGEFTQLSLNNPADSGHLLIFEGFYSPVLPGLVTLSLIRGIIFTGVDIFQVPLDGRIPTGNANIGVGFVRRGSNVAKQGGEHVLLPTVMNRFYNFLAVLSPGDSVLIQSDLVNQSVGVTFRWRETVLEPSARA